MKVELLYFDGCPHWEIADQRLTHVAGASGLVVERRLVTTPEEAEACRFRGSPTILVDGLDPFATGDEDFGLSCRIYQTPDGPAGAPTIEQLEGILDTTGVPHLPGPVGRIVRLVLGLLTLQAALGTALALVDGPSGGPDLDDTGLAIAIVIGAWLTPTVFDIGLGTNHGSRWRLFVIVGIGATIAGGAAIDTAATGLTVGILVWITVTLGWLGIAFLIAAILRTPGCEMRSLPHLASLVLSGGRGFVACPGPLQPLDEWEARATGRAEPYRPS